MKNAGKFLMFVILPLVFMSCGNGLIGQLKANMEMIKSQCPQDQGNGVILVDANFYEDEKVLEYISSIEGRDSIDDATVERMREAMIEALSSDVSAFEKFSVKTIMNTYDYRFRYIYTDIEGNSLCKIEITKNDLR